MSSFTQNLTNFVTRQVESVREMTAPVLRESKFVEKGVLTPDEFVHPNFNQPHTSPNAPRDQICRKEPLLWR